MNAPDRTQDLSPGLQALQTEGLNLRELENGQVLEHLVWSPAKPTSMPDAELTVLLQYRDPIDNQVDLCMGWWDGEIWHECVSGGWLHAEVLMWADPQGPKA